MKLIPNWKDIALKSFSMWCVYLGIVALAVPALAYVLFAWDTNPLIWGWLGIALLITGGVGRLVDQGIDNPKPPYRSTTLRSPWVIGVLALAVMAYAVWSGERQSEIDLSDLPTAGVEVESEPTAPAPGSDAEFLQIAVPVVGGLEGRRLSAYLDIVGVPTICYGETKGVKMGDTATAEECDAMLAEQILLYRAGIHGYFTDDTLANRLPINRDVAFSSFAYNVGIAGAGGSTATRRLNAGNVRGACEALTWWNKAGGRVIRGLVRRRTVEHGMCMDGVA